MNIKITYNWLLEFLETDASPDEIRKYLSLCGPSVERVTKVGEDYVFDIEVTSNRVDTACVLGIAQEAVAILPEFGKKAKMKRLQQSKQRVRLQNGENLTLSVEDPQRLCNRLFAVAMEVAVGTLPDYMRKRLEMCDVRSLNNLIDITNYIMLEVGHPTHVFDYDRIKTGRLVLRHAKKGEPLVTLDEKKYELVSSDVVIDDGTGRIIDLPGIMGTANSVVTDKTKWVVFFIESNNPSVIRKTSMRLGIRTMAATINEKNPDSERAKQAFFQGIALFEQYAKGKVASNLIDTDPVEKNIKPIKVSTEFINRRVGITLDSKKVEKIMLRLGFGVKNIKNEFELTPPSYRSSDVSIQEDVVEEVARIYGYHNLPNVIQPAAYIKQPKEIESFFLTQSKVKHFLKHLGLHEVLNYSMISKKTIDDFDLGRIEHLRLKNTISSEIEYMRHHIMASLIMNIKENEGRSEMLRFFEIAKTYKPKKGDLPIEEYKLGIVVNTDLLDLKGVVDSLLSELNIADLSLKPSKHPLLKAQEQCEIITATGDWLGEFGSLKTLYKSRIELNSNIYIAVFDFKNLIRYSNDLPVYHKINLYATIKLDLTLKQKKELPYSELKKIAYQSSGFLNNLELVDQFEDKITLRFYFASDKNNLTEEEAKEELEKIKLLINKF